MPVRKVRKSISYKKRGQKTKTRRTKRTHKKTRKHVKFGGVYIDPNYGSTNPYPFVDPHD